MKNNLSPPLPQHLKTNIVYSFKCPFAHSNVHEYEYIGLTSTTLENRLRNHTYRGSIKEHILHEHNTSVTKTQLIENTSILAHAENRHKLFIKEALLILQKSPIINCQYDNFCNVLKLYKSRNNPNHSNSSYQNNNDTTHIIAPSPQPEEIVSNQHHENTLSPRLRHQASPQIVRQINELFSNNNNTVNNNPTQTRYSLRSRANQR